MFKELAKLPVGRPDFEKLSEIYATHGISFVQILMPTMYKSNSGSGVNLTRFCV
tara:strand:- start:6988 stop:7149 length:162 start_codon:yes stop_codon:yes gene_type:complete